MAAEVGTFIGAALLKIVAEHEALPGVPIQHAGNDREQGGLAAARRAHQHEQFAVVDVKIDAAQGGRACIPGPISLFQASATDSDRVRLCWVGRNGRHAWIGRAVPGG
ncbi:hypothetical protein CBM2598_U10037 [Cupriavidus taiwanensis]|nr:hypothetical protein CBM2598_U10037 [Cupriavidus taiwanensis]